MLVEGGLDFSSSTIYALAPMNQFLEAYANYTPSICPIGAGLCRQHGSQSENRSGR
jgi:hypothetical protein